MPADQEAAAATMVAGVAAFSAVAVAAEAAGWLGPVPTAAAAALGLVAMA